MGCCVSKCKPSPSPQEEHLFNVQQKLPISQTPPIIPIPTLYSSTRISPSPPSPTSSTSSISSFTCTTTNTSSSSSSSSFTSKDRSFSNDFLWSCYKDNPHITRINSLREPSLSFMPPTKPKPQHTNTKTLKPNLATTLKQSPTQSLSMPQKRVRSNSPTNLTRQKSFRKDTERSIIINYASNNMQSWTSPSRRFNGADKCASPNNLATTVTDSRRRMMNSSKVSVSAIHSHCVSSSTRKESVKGASPRRVVHSGLRHTESCSVGVGSKVDETVVKDVMSDHDMDLTLMEDIDNPLISLDCFIFL
ncbi:A-agglutinin anchorage subunit [Cajanus cajan]|uniref:Uncharacterized protein n=1 Tax=Cajanus cajan TaxID=3821 RepID=A0A151RBM7_CAJCA|nr:A-agglutinin anchorage subunit [Cajanus cajan]KYP40044.1 hypothetical protein KK1_038626 [Cajanus cajan]